MLGHKPKSEFRRNIVTLMTGTTISQVIPIAITPILTRLYSPEDFGVFAFYVAITSILAVIATGRYELAIMLPKNNKDAANVLCLSMLVALFFSTFLALLIYLFSPEINSLFEEQGVESWLYLLPASIFIVATYNSLNYWHNRHKRFTISAQSKVLQSGSTCTSQFSLKYLSLSNLGLIFGWFIGQLCAVFLFLFKLYKNDKNYLCSCRRLKIVALGKKYSRFPKLNSFSALANTASVQMPVFLFATLFSAVQAGFFSLAQRILMLPMAFMGASIGHVFFQNLSKLKNSNGAMSTFTVRIYQKLVMIGIIPTVIILLFGQDLFAMVFGREWEIAGRYAELMSFWTYFVFISSPLSHILTVYEKHFEALVYNLILLGSRVLILLLGWLYIDDPLITVGFYGAFGTVLLCLFVFYLMRLVGSSYLDIVKPLLIAALILIPALLYNITKIT